VHHTHELEGRVFTSQEHINNPAKRLSAIEQIN
jgi:hypothetical protein